MNRLQSKAYDIIGSAKHYSFENNLRKRAVTVFQYMNGIKENEPLIKFKFFDHKIGIRGNQNLLIVPKCKNEAPENHLFVKEL